MQKLFLTFFMAILLANCAQTPKLKPFSSDGCSLFPDKDYQNNKSWCQCCVVHDEAYWKGGTDSEREAADKALKACVLEKTGDANLAELMYVGTRAGGSQYFPNWYRWGYGWPYGSESKISESYRKQEVARNSGYDLAAITKNICNE